MKRVYLDQNHWIALSAARAGEPKGSPKQHEAAQDVLALGRALVERGDVSFPLSAVHYQETWQRRDWESRRALADTMYELSRLHAIAWQYTLVDAEIEHAIWAAYGGPRPDPIVPFGVGTGHSSKGPGPPPYRIPEPYRARMDPDEVWRIEDEAKQLRERTILAGLPPEAAADDRYSGWNPAAWQQVATARAAEEEMLRAERKAANRHKGEWGTRVFIAEAYAEHADKITAALERAEQPAWVVGRRKWEGVIELIQSIPTLHAISEFRRVRHTASERRFEASDALDQMALPAPLVYCDVVVTEKQHAARLGDLAARHGTVLLGQLSDLPQHLV